ncbi:PhoH family protein [uncultured Porphyromonas sp.]|uniref:PhoH family protein n=1 Tax=uncultured Porphyromonas sp. TaxID=159274 RepID=UPI0026119112|nr:PhoH family protein [uncultured Porphyromonas sp.]
MTERLYILEEIDPAVLYGPNREYLLLLRNLYPKLRIVAHDRIIKILGDPTDIQLLTALLDKLVQHITRYNLLTEQTIRKLATGEELPEVKVSPNHLLYGARGRSIGYRGAHQREMVEAIADHDMLFAIGPAGTGKTYIAIALAVKALKEKQVRRIILSRPAVEAGEKLGFLPGELKDKLDPYLQPLYDALEEMIPTQRLRTYMESDVIQIAPLAYMRGRTLNDAVVILDEAQNTTHHQMKMFLTRLGRNSKMIITGDLSQVDLPRGVTSGLRIAERILSDVEQIPFVYFDAQDIVRHPIVQLVVDAYDRNEHQALQGGRPTQETRQQQDIDLDKDQSKDS